MFTFTDGVHTYSHDFWDPDVTEPETIPGQIFITLSGKRIWCSLENASSTDKTLPKDYIVNFIVTDPDFLAYAHEAWQAKRQITITYPLRIGTSATRWVTQKSITGYITAFDAKLNETVPRQTSLSFTVSEVGLG